jgi:hypothetical protein
LLSYGGEEEEEDDEAIPEILRKTGHHEIASTHSCYVQLRQCERPFKRALSKGPDSDENERVPLRASLLRNIPYDELYYERGK